MANLDFLHGGNIYEAKGKYKKEIIDFSANINPLGLPAEVKKAIDENFDRILHYPDPQAKSLTQKIARYWRVKNENILVGNGSVELIYLIMHAFRPKSTLMPAPTFSEYERAARSINCRIRFLKLKEKQGFGLDLSQTPAADILFLCNPNNPTGNLVLESPQIPPFPPLIKGGEERLVIVDEAFMDFLPDEKNHTLIRTSLKNKHLIVLRTFTKFFALPGLRIGYLVAHKDIIRTLKEHQAPWSTNAPAQVAAELILNNKTYIKKTHVLIEKERKFLFDRISRIKGLTSYPSAANFILIKIEDKNLTSSLLTKRLAGKGILIRDCANFRGLNDKFIRIAVRSHKENLALIGALKDMLWKK